MPPQDTGPPSPPPDGEFKSGDPWQAFGYLVSGVAFYGFLGWLADRWLGTSFLVAIGIVIGMSLGIYLTWKRFSLAENPDAGPRS